MSSAGIFAARILFASGNTFCTFTFISFNSWQAKLFLQPLYDMKVIYVAITLLVTCIVLLIVVAVLQYLEVREDQKERMQESQRFHFDAM